MRFRLPHACMALACTLALAGCGKKAEESAPAPAANAPAATPIDAATAGSVSGTVKLDGAAPKAARLKTEADPFCSKMHTSAPLTSEEVVAGAGGALANVVVYVKTGLENRTFETPKTAVELNQEGCQYKPHVIGVQTNQTVQIVSADDTTHNVHPTPVNNPDWNQSQGPKAAALTHTFAREEIAVPVKCNIHGWMKSYVAVFKHPYFQVTKADGTFELKNLPPGDYTIEAWQEKYGKTEQKVTVGPKESKKIDFVFKAS
jgi:plastocyanin